MNVVECTIPRDMTIEQWRRLRRGVAPTRRAALPPDKACDHLHDTASRYEHAAKRLELLLICPVCKTEKVIHALAYEPRFEPSGAAVHALRGRRVDARQGLDRAA